MIQDSLPATTLVFPTLFSPHCFGSSTEAGLELEVEGWALPQGKRNGEGQSEFPSFFLKRKTLKISNKQFGKEKKRIARGI